MDFSKLTKLGLKHIASLKKEEMDQLQEKEKNLQRLNIKLDHQSDKLDCSKQIEDLDQKLDNI